MATDMHVWFKVQLVVEFYIYSLWPSHSQIQKKTAKTSAGASTDATSTPSAVSSPSRLWVSLAEAADFPLLRHFFSGLKSPSGTRYTVFLLRGSIVEWGRWTGHNHIAERGPLLSVPFHISPQTQVGSLCMNMGLR